MSAIPGSGATPGCCLLTELTCVRLGWKSTPANVPFMCGKDGLMDYPGIE